MLCIDHNLRVKMPNHTISDRYSDFRSLHHFCFKLLSLQVHGGLHTSIAVPAREVGIPTLIKPLGAACSATCAVSLTEALWQLRPAPGACV